MLTMAEGRPVGRGQNADGVRQGVLYAVTFSLGSAMPMSQPATPSVVVIRHLACTGI